MGESLSAVEIEAVASQPGDSRPRADQRAVHWFAPMAAPCHGPLDMGSIAQFRWAATAPDNRVVFRTNHRPSARHSSRTAGHGVQSSKQANRRDAEARSRMKLKEIGASDSGPSASPHLCGGSSGRRPARTAGHGVHRSVFGRGSL